MTFWAPTSYKGAVTVSVNAHSGAFHFLDKLYQRHIPTSSMPDLIVIAAVLPIFNTTKRLKVLYRKDAIDHHARRLVSFRTCRNTASPEACEKTTENDVNGNHLAFI